jgi:thiamine biosynthesis lipoprotein
MKHFVVLLGLAAWLAAAPLHAGPLVRVEASVDAMGSTYTVALYGESRDQLEAIIEQAFEEVRRLDRMLSNYRRDSEWSEVNRFAAQRPVRVTLELFRLLERCQEYSRRSEGAFDISVGPLMKVWGFYRGSGRLPDKAAVRQALETVGYRHMSLDAEHRSVRFDRPGVELDPGGIGKGYAVDRMADVLRENGVSSGLISAGSSSIYALGAPPGARGWKVSIRHPRNSGQVVAEVHLKNESMSTSGSYEKFFQANGRTYSHIMDPRTGFPASGMLSVSVIAPSTLDSEAWTKPIFINGRAWAARNKPKTFRAFLCEDKAELSCAWLQ